MSSSGCATAFEQKGRELGAPFSDVGRPLLITSVALVLTFQPFRPEGAQLENPRDAELREVA